LCSALITFELAHFRYTMVSVAVQIGTHWFQGKSQATAFVDSLKIIIISSISKYTTTVVKLCFVSPFYDEGNIPAPLCEERSSSVFV